MGNKGAIYYTRYILINNPVLNPAQGGTASWVPGGSAGRSFQRVMSQVGDVTHLAVVIQDSGRSSLGCSRKVSQPPADVDSLLSVANSGVISWSTCDILGPVFLEHVKAAACCRPELARIFRKHLRGSSHSWRT